MPHIVPWHEKRQLCQIPQTARAIKIPDKFLDRAMEIGRLTWSTATAEDQLTIFKLLEDIVEDTMTSNLSDNTFFKDFVEIKGDTYGRYNSDSDYRGS